MDNNTPNQRRVPKEARRPFGAYTQKLAYESRVGYHRHWFNDIPGRIDQAVEAGYTHVIDKEGKKVQRVVGTNEGGSALTGFLMETPDEWYQEDMARQQMEVDKVDEAVRRGAVADSPDGNRYIPSRGISIRDGNKR